MKPPPTAEVKKPAADAKASKATKKAAQEGKDQVDADVVVVSKMKPRGSSNSR